MVALSGSLPLCADNIRPMRLGLYDVTATIGKGKFAVIKLATHRIAKITVAIKMIDKKRLSPANLKHVYREIEVLKRLSHPNILKLYQVMETANMIYIVTDFATGGDLFDYIDRFGRVTESEARAMFGHIVSALQYSHRQGVAHRDIKMENLLLDKEGRVKVADWGLCNYFSEDLSLHTWCGSLPYAAPEVYNETHYSGSQVDVWSMGVVLYVLVCGALPFQASSVGKLRNLIVSGSVQYPDFISDDCRSLIQSMLVVDPKQRMSVCDIPSHPWMTHLSPRATPDPAPPASALDRTESCPCCCPDISDNVVNVMMRMGVDVSLTRASLQKEAYDHHMGLFLLLKERLSHVSPANHASLCPPGKVASKEESSNLHTTA